MLPRPRTRSDPEAPGALSKNRNVSSSQAEPLKCYCRPKSTYLGEAQPGRTADQAGEEVSGLHAGGALVAAVAAGGEEAAGRREAQERELRTGEVDSCLKYEYELLDTQHGGAGRRGASRRG